VRRITNDIMTTPLQLHNRNHIRLLFMTACEEGDLLGAQRLAHDHNLTWKDVHADKYGCIGYMTDYLPHRPSVEGGTHGDCTYRSIPLRLACAGGHLEVAKWLTEKYSLTIDDARYDLVGPLRDACEYGHLAAAQWLVKRFWLTPKDVRADNYSALVGAEERNHTDIVAWLRETYGAH
jgi:hypothetical protein